MSNQYRRTAFLHEMGLGPIWSQRGAATPQADTEIAMDAAPADVPARQPTVVADTASAWAEQTPTAAVSMHVPVASEVVTITSLADIACMDWTQLKSVVAGCTQCGLCKNRTQTVFGVGDQKAKWLFVGEGPGRNEDFQGEPFVGPAGKLLDNMFGAMGLKRGENTYIANIVKCRPTDASKHDRPPAAEEVAACISYLERQIALIKPTVIVALGKTAAISLLKLDPATPVGKLRGTVHRYADLPLIVTYHPAYLLRNLKDKSKAWADLCLAMQTYADSPSA